MENIKNSRFDQKDTITEMDNMLQILQSFFLINHENRVSNEISTKIIKDYLIPKLKNGFMNKQSQYQKDIQNKIILDMKYFTVVFIHKILLKLNSIYKISKENNLIELKNQDKKINKSFLIQKIFYEYKENMGQISQICSNEK